MYVVTKLPGEGHKLQRAIQLSILVQAEIWAPELLERPLPGIYELPLRFRPEPKTSIAEEWVDPYTVVRRGFGDCDDLVIFRLAQIFGEQGLPEDGIRSQLPAWPCVYWLRGSGDYHVLIRHASGQDEDPAKFFLEKYG